MSVDLARIDHVTYPKKVRRNYAMHGYERITKADFYLNGGFANSRCVRVTRNGAWAYYWRLTA